MRLQFSVRSLLGLVFFFSLVFSLVSFSYHAVSGGADDPVAPYVSFIVGLGGFTFWLVLLMPFWIPFFFVSPEVRKRDGIRPFLALVPVTWYCILIWLYLFLLRPCPHLILLKLGAAIGTFLACTALVLTWRRRWYVLGAPLGIAIISGTVWLIVGVR